MRKLTLCMVLAACGDNASQTKVPTIADYEQAAAVALCSYLARCGQISSSQQASCQTTYTTQIFNSGYTPDQSISSGRTQYDSAAAQVCIDTIAGLDCNLKGLFSLGQTTSCRGVLRGTVGNGGACKAQIECQSSFYCGTGQPGCDSTCVPFAATGAACGATALCGPSDYCSNNVCVARGTQGATCSGTLLCVSDLHCNGTTCQPAVGVGSPCTSSGFDDNCPIGAYCDQSGTSPVCRTPLPLGAVCVQGQQCAAGTRCSSGTCQTFADIGQSCAMKSCAGDAMCDATTKLCKLVGQVGDDCTNSSCGQGNYCRADKTCQPKLLLGSACDPTISSQCIVGNCDMTTHVCTLPCGP